MHPCMSMYPDECNIHTHFPVKIYLRMDISFAGLCSSPDVHHGRGIWSTIMVVPILHRPSFTLPAAAEAKALEEAVEEASANLSQSYRCRELLVVERRPTICQSESSSHIKEPVVGDLKWFSRSTFGKIPAIDD